MFANVYQLSCFLNLYDIFMTNIEELLSEFIEE